MSQAKGGASEPAHASNTAVAAGIDTLQAPPQHSNSSSEQAGPQSGGEQDAVEAALAAQRPHPNLSASAPVSEAVVAEAVDNMDEARLGDASAALQSAPTTVKQAEGTGQAANADSVAPTEVATGSNVSAAKEAQQGSDSLPAAASSYEAGDERAWTIQHVRRSSSFI